MKMPALFFNMALLLTSINAYAEQGKWFEGFDLDYWNEGRKVRSSGIASNELGEDDSAIKKLPASSSIIRSSDFLPFDWKNYENPLSPQFWDDGGNYVPPRPLRILAANPSDTNVEKYLAWQRLKIETTNRLSQLLGARHPASVQNHAASDNRAVYERHRPASPSVHRQSQIQWDKLSLNYVYRTSCPHCKRMTGVIDELIRRGVKVTAYQIDSASEAPLLADSKPISEAELGRLGVTVTPTLFFHNQQKTSKIEGFVSQDALEVEVEKLF